MRPLPRSFLYLALAAIACATHLFAQKKPFDIDTLLKIQRISEPALSPDGKTVVFTVQAVDLAKNNRPKQIYSVPVEGGSPRQLTREGASNDHPRWSPDSKQIYFISNRPSPLQEGAPQSGGIRTQEPSAPAPSSQIWVMDADGSNPRQITRLSTEASGVVVSPDGKKIVFQSSVYPECAPQAGNGAFDEACNKRNLEADEKSPSKARIYTSLLFRHWNEYRTRRRNHLLVANADGTGIRDLTPGSRDVPPFSLGGPDAYAISPDSNELAFVMNVDAEPAISTNSDIYTVPLAGGEPKKITISPGGDDGPLYSPDGKYLAFRSQARAGYESDRFRLLVLERATGKTTSLTETLDRWVGSYTWSPDSTRLFFTVEDRGRTGLQMIPATGGAARTIINGASSLDNVQFTSDGRTMIYTEESGSRPVEIYRATSGGGTGSALTRLNDALLAGAVLTPLEELWVESYDKTRVHSFIVKPPDFSASRKYPVLFLIHGGPQGAWGESWTYRWNAQVFAGAGYVVVMPNQRGSTGYGQKFIDEINGDWGGKAYDDVMAVADAVAALPYVDRDRMAAAGGSYGGYLVNWLLGHTTRFKALISHAGVFDLASEARETEELWFPIWEFRGMPHDNPDLYAKWSPSAFVKDFKTPTLVIHGELDYRVPVGQGLQLFTSLQLQKVPSKLLLFPDEGHWVLKPQNTVLWYKTFLDWIGEWTKK
jgi:dipeptidyl aminopeptidase/acylaminoacyl peptidase